MNGKTLAVPKLEHPVGKTEWRVKEPALARTFLNIDENPFGSTIVPDGVRNCV